jgi:hypothetical protein
LEPNKLNSTVLNANTKPMTRPISFQDLSVLNALSKTFARPEYSELSPLVLMPAAVTFVLKYERRGGLS